MPLSTYAELKTSIANWLDNSDPAKFIAVIPDFIALAEAELNDVLRTRSMLHRATSTATEEYLSLPSDFLEMRSLCTTGSDARELQPVTDDRIRDLNDGGTVTGTPLYFAISGTNARLFPVPTNATVEMAYYRRIPALSDSNTSNWLLSSRPQAYLWLALSFAADFLVDPRADRWRALAEKAISDLRTSDARGDGGENSPTLSSDLVGGNRRNWS